jgi:hypothetical protein
MSLVAQALVSLFVINLIMNENIDYLSAFRNLGVPGPTSELSPRAPAQMGRREAEREGGRKQPEGDRRGTWYPRPSC